jgi:hypothetical protein
MSLSTETMEMPIETKTKDCTECGETLTNWWENGYGEAFCSPCFKEAGHQCDGCWDEDCVQCNEEDGECPGCLRPKADEEYREARCCRCDREMCDQCYSVSPIEGDDECYCKRCAQDRLDEEEKKGKKMCEFCEEYGDTPRLATIRRCIGGCEMGNAYDHLCEVCDKRGDEEMKEWAKAEAEDLAKDVEDAKVRFFGSAERAKEVFAMPWEEQVAVIAAIAKGETQ